jgi:hypothetical protein
VSYRPGVEALEARTLPSLFGPVQGIAVGSEPVGVAVGDFNGDGLSDVAVANFGDNTVSVLLRNRQGGFTAAPGSPIHVGGAPVGVAVGDFNGDGIPDLAVTNSLDNTVSVLLGNGDGSFTAAAGSPITVGSSPHAVMVGDFNGDGFADLAVGNANDNTVSVLLGNGKGGFSPIFGSPFSVGQPGGPGSVAVGDFDRNGFADLAVAGSAQNNVTILLSHGFFFEPAPGPPITVGSDPLSVAVGDFNGDGIPDLAVANLLDNTVSVLLGNGDGTFTPAPGSPVSVGAAPLGLAVADFNGDGVPDLAVGGDPVLVLLGDGKGGFGVRETLPVSFRPSAVAVGDFNGDGLPDLAVNGAVFLSQPGGRSVAATGGFSVTGVEGASPSKSTVATFTDPTGPGNMADYSADITFGNGPTTPGIISFNADTGVFTVTAGPAPEEEGTYPITVTIHTAGAPATTVTSTAVISDAALTATGMPIAASEENSFTGSVAFFSDTGGPENANNYTALIDWGDGTKTQGTVRADNAGFLVLGTHTYLAAGSPSVSTTILDDGGMSATAGSTATVADAPLTATPRTVNFTEAASSTQVVASFQDANPNEFSGQFTAMISWGDGSPSSPGPITANGAGFDVSGTHAYASKGTYPITVTIQDTGTSTVANSTAVVSPPPLIGTPLGISVFNNLNFSGTVATFSDPDPRKNAAGYQATIFWPDNNTTSVVTPTGANPFKVSGSHVFSAFAGTLTLKVVVVDLQTPGRSVTILSRVADPPASEMDRIYVTQLYADLLQRPPDDGGLAYWAGLLDHGVSRQDVTAGIVASPEYKMLEVRHLYTTLLHRDADPPGLQAFTGFLMAGGTVEQVQALMTASPEYYQTRGGGTNAGFLTALYQDALSRAIDPTGQSAFGQALAQGVARQDVAAAVFTSDEYERDFVSGYYSRFLGRAADPYGLTAFTSALRQGLRDEAVIAAITASDEYFAELQLPLG